MIEIENKERLMKLLEGLECNADFWSQQSPGRLYLLGQLITEQAKNSPGRFDLMEIAKVIANTK